MNHLRHAILVLSGLPLLVFAQTTSQSYAGQETRAIKALSQEQINAYLQGQGMGLAKAAELNHYPGPKHILELSEKLLLSSQENSKAQAVYDKMHTEAVRVGKQVVDKEKTLDALFASGAINDEQLVAVVNDIARLQGELRIIHLRAHLEMRKLLSTEQLANYDELRGYGQSKGAQHQNGQHLH